MGETHAGMYRTQIKIKTFCTEQVAGEAKVERAKENEQMVTKEAKE
jgi:hypothetical protein